MKVSLNWLMDFVPGLREVAGDAARASAVLTRIGFEVEAVHPFAQELSGLRVARVLAVRPHPQADKLRLVRIDGGQGETEVVCGAPNVPDTGGRVCWAAPGATLPGGLKIETRPVRGVVSPGMLCSETELGIGEGDHGIIVLSELDKAQPGDDFVRAFALADEVLEVNVTPNRPDALSHIGIARELAAALGLGLRLPEPVPGVSLAEAVKVVAGAPSRQVKIADADGCPRYLARFVHDVTVAPSPLVLRARLVACGVRAISNLVDVTNYVLLELGHPLHAFDDAQLEGHVEVRRARAGEVMTTLDRVERKLEPGDLVIADQRGAVALAGVMGGATSEVGDATRQVFLECATFEPAAIRRTARRLALHSESSHRFERGVDSEGVPRAAERAARLLALLGAGAMVDATIDEHPRPWQPRTVRLPLEQLRRVSGLAAINAEDASAQLSRVTRAVRVEGQGDAAALVADIPSYRPDLALAEDLTEEIMRLVGYDQIPARNPVSNAVSHSSPEAPADRARDGLAAAGLREIVTWGFVPRAALAALAPDAAAPAFTEGVAVKNPISADYEVMRTSLLPGLVETARRNLARGVASPWLFEVGPVVHRRGGEPQPQEALSAAGLLCGQRFGWLRPGAPVDFYDAKQVLLDVLASFGLRDVALQPGSDVPYLHPGVSGVVRLQGDVVARVGEVHPVVRHRLGLEVPAFVLELAPDKLARSSHRPRTVLPPRFPGSTRDVSFFVDVAVPAAAQHDAFAAAREPLLREIAVVEDFRDPARVPAGKKSMLWTLTYRADDRTLTDEDVDRAHAAVLQSLATRLPVDIR